jgi:hypothetical protein
MVLVISLGNPGIRVGTASFYDNGKPFPAIGFDDIDLVLLSRDRLPIMTESGSATTILKKIGTNDARYDKAQPLSENLPFRCSSDEAIKSATSEIVRRVKSPFLSSVRSLSK